MASVLISGPAGCRPELPPSDAPAAPHRGAELRLAVPTEATAALLHGPGRAWALRQGAGLTVARYDPSHEDGPAAAGPADVWVIAPADLPRWAAAGRLLPLPETYTLRENPFGWTDLLPTYREQLVPWEGTPYGLPVVGEAPLCCYRLDRFAADRDAFQKEFGRPPSAPATWEQFAELAEYFHRKGGPSLPPLPAGDAELDRLFYTVAAGFARRAVPADEARSAARRDEVFAFHYDLATGRPRVAGPGFVHALRLLRRLQACRPDKPAERPEEAFRDGRAVLCLADAPWLKTFQQAPALRDKVGVARVPGGDRYFDFATGRPQPAPAGNRVPYLGGAGWLAVVPRGTEHPEAAFDLLADLAGPKASSQIFLSENREGGPVRAEPLYRERWDVFDLDAAQTLRLREAMQEALLHRSLKNPALCLRTPHHAAHRAILVKAVRDVLFGGADAEKALQGVAEAWESLDREQGMEAHREDYRRSVGLLAK